MNVQNYYGAPRGGIRRQDAGYENGDLMDHEMEKGGCKWQDRGFMPVGYAPQMGMRPEYGRMQPRDAVPGRWQPSPVPFYQMPGYPQVLWQEMESERDMQKIKEMYPDAAREILPYIEEECDRMEYDGSVMFDEYPDRVMTRRIRDHIYDRVKDRFELPEGNDQDEVFVMNRETRRRYPPKKNWLGDLIDVLLFQEMHRRRCRHRNCGSRFW